MTVTANDSVTLPLPSDARTSTFAVPSRFGATLSLLPSSARVTTLASALNVNASASPLGSSNTAARSISTGSPPRSSAASAIGRTTTGGGLTTTTSKASVALPCPSLAVTVIVASPSPAADTRSTPSPQTPTLATAGELDWQVNASGSAFGSVNTVSRRIARGSEPSSIDRSAIGRSTVGGGFVTSTVNASWTLSPSGSVAVTVTVAAPAASGATVSVPPPHPDADATDGALDAHVNVSASPSGSENTSESGIEIGASPSASDASGIGSETTGGAFPRSTDTEKDSPTGSLKPSDADTVTVASPAASGVTASSPLEHPLSAAMLGLLDEHVNARSVPSGSSNTEVRAISKGSSPTTRATSGMGSTVTGASFASTVTANASCVLSPSGSVAVTVTVAAPAASGATVSVPPPHPDADATDGALDAHVNVSASPSGSENTAVRSAVKVPMPAVSVTSSSGCTTVGGAFGASSNVAMNASVSPLWEGETEVTGKSSSDLVLPVTWVIPFRSVIPSARSASSPPK